MQKLQSWSNVRFFIEKYDINLVFETMSPFFASQVIVGVMTMGIVVYMVFTGLDQVEGSLITLLFSYDLYLLLATIVLLWTILLTGILNSRHPRHPLGSLYALYSGYVTTLVVSLFGTIPHQINILDTFQQQCLSDSSTDTTALVTYIEKLKENILKHSQPPKILGIYVRPTFLNLFKGYLVSGIVAILLKYLHQLLPSINP